MKTLKIAFFFVLLVPTGLWLLADTFLPNPFTYFSFRGVFVQYSGVMAIAVMSVAMMLAMRPKWLEPMMRGLDKMYRLHKWLGISALVFAVSHWWFAKGTKWMVGWGWLTKPERGPRPAQESLGFWEAIFNSQRELAETIGEWAFYAAAILMVLALIKRFPYRWFAKTHQLLAVTYLLFAYHAIILLKLSYWSQPVGWLTAGLIAVGVCAAVWVLSGKVGAKQKVDGEVIALNHHEDMRVIEVEVKADTSWAGHKAGQFAFVTSSEKEGAHPYTIASAWDAQYQSIRFIIKALGDHTSRLSDLLKVGMKVEVEGPYGHFDFEDQQARQIWIGAGIGITPFIARMQQLMVIPDGKTIDLFHPTAKISDELKAKLAEEVSGAGVDLHLMLSEQDGRLTAQRIMESVPDWKMASIWFCGPNALGESLQKDFIAQGFSADKFHQELFHLR